MLATNATVVKLLEQVGAMDKIREAAQVDREAERAAILEEMDAQIAKDAEIAATCAEAEAKVLAKIGKAEAELAAARKALADLRGANSMSGFRVEKLKGKLRRLADPRIDQAIRECHDLFDRARHGFGVGTVYWRNRRGESTPVQASNATSVAERMADCRTAIATLEALQVAARPDDLDAVIEIILAPLRTKIH